MNEQISAPLVVRRSFISRLGLGAAALGAGLAVAPPARSQQATGFSPARHALDDWYDRPNVKHRFVLDSTSPNSAGGAILYASNFFAANKSGYNLDPADLAVVIVLRHFSTPFAYNDAIWGKYGAHISEALNFTDPKTNRPPSTNLYNASGYGFALPNFDNTLDSLVQRGVQFAVCDMATKFFAGMLAGKTSGDSDAIYRELAANLIPNSHMAPAGIVAVNRAQERGYTLASVSA